MTVRNVASGISSVLVWRIALASISTVLDVGGLSAQCDVLYGDWIDSVGVAKAKGDLRSAQRFYQAAFDRRPALVMHATDRARVGWLLHDTLDTQVHVQRALELGESGEALASDSILSAFWRSPAAMESRSRWAEYRALELPEIKSELEAMFKEDQDARRAIDWEKADSPDSLVRRSVWGPVEALDEQHTRRVIEIIREHGIPSVRQVGLMGNKMVFFAFIHANDNQVITDHILRLSASVQKGESPACWYAYLIDRVMVRTSKETMFGTSGYTDRTDGVTYFTSVVPALTDLLRESMGLPRMHSGRNTY